MDKEKRFNIITGIILLIIVVATALGAGYDYGYRKSAEEISNNYGNGLNEGYQIGYESGLSTGATKAKIENTNLFYTKGYDACKNFYARDEYRRGYQEAKEVHFKSGRAAGYEHGYKDGTLGFADVIEELFRRRPDLDRRNSSLLEGGS